MNKRTLWIVVITLIVLGLGVGALMMFSPQNTPAAVEDQGEITGFSFPASAGEINWEDREIFMTGLVPGAQAALTQLPQASTYYITLEIPDDLISGITGHLIVHYTNAEAEPLNEIYFRLYPNFQGGLSAVSNLTVDGNSLTPTLESSQTALRVDLNTPLDPGQNLVLELDFQLETPTEMGGNYGLYGYFEDVLVLDTFYPMIPAYDQNGWYSQEPQGNGDLTYQDTSFYIVEVSAPADLVLASSGVAVAQKVEGGTKTTIFAAGPARDFYLAGSREFVEMTDQVGDTTVRVLTRPEYSTNQALALDYAGRALEIFSNTVGEYPYTEFEVISSPMRALGIEYPGITSIVVDEFVDGVELYGLPTAQMLESTLAHEAGHMWFYNAVGNDQQNEPWVDESLTQYVTYIYYEERYGDGGGYVDSWMGRWSTVEHVEIPIGLPAGEYQGREYSGIVYGRGPLFFWALEQDYGQETVMAGIQSYYADFLWGNAGTEDLREALEGACDCDLGSYFEQWIYRK